MCIRNTLLAVPVSSAEDKLFIKGEWNVELRRGLVKLWLWYLFFLNGKVQFKWNVIGNHFLYKSVNNVECDRPLDFDTESLRYSKCNFIAFQAIDLSCKVVLFGWSVHASVHIFCCFSCMFLFSSSDTLIKNIRETDSFKYLLLNLHLLGRLKLLKRSSQPVLLICCVSEFSSICAITTILS